MNINSLSAARARAAKVQPNCIRISDPTYSKWVRRAYRHARKMGCPEWAARNLLWETLFVSNLEKGGVWVASAEAVTA